MKLKHLAILSLLRLLRLLLNYLTKLLAGLPVAAGSFQARAAGAYHIIVFGCGDEVAEQHTEE